MKPVVALDLDELIFPFVTNLIGWYNERAGVSLQLDDYYTFTFEDVWNRTSLEVVEIVHEFFAQLPPDTQPIEGAIEGVSELESMFDLLVVTARADELQVLTLNWLQQHFPEVFRSIHLCNLYIPGRASARGKADVCIDEGAIALVDDSLSHVTDVARVGLRGVLFGDYPWNRTEELPANVTRAKNWNDVVVQLKEIA